MSTRVELPTGCYGLKMPDGTKYDAKPGRSVVVEDHHARQVAKSSNAKLGIVDASKGYAIGTRRGKRCDDCQFLAQGWASACPRCGGGVTTE